MNDPDLASAPNTETADESEPLDGDVDAAHVADRLPTAAEETEAVKGAQAVDLDSVRRHEEEMIERGANAKGEGQID